MAGVIELERTELTEAWARDEADIFGVPLPTYETMKLGPWAVPMRLFGFPTASALWHVFGAADGGDDVGGLGLIDPSTNQIFRRVPFDHAIRVENGSKLQIEYVFSIDFG